MLTNYFRDFFAINNYLDILHTIDEYHRNLFDSQRTSENNCSKCKKKMYFICFQRYFCGTSNSFYLEMLAPVYLWKKKKIK